VAHARAIVAQMGRMKTELGRYSDGLRATLLVLANTSATDTLMPAAMADFLITHPDIDIDLQERPSHEIVAAITDGRVELGIIADTADAGSLECTPLREDRLVVVAPRDHALADRSSVAFSACLDHPFLGLAEGNPLQEHLSGQTEPLGLRPRYRAHLPSMEAIITAVVAGVGIAVVPSLAPALLTHRAQLSVVELTNSWAHRHLLLCYRHRSGLSAAATARSAHLMSAAKHTDDRER
jgi:DNA-binding transcriptional LysR family regulator